MNKAIWSISTLKKTVNPILQKKLSPNQYIFRFFSGLIIINIILGAFMYLLDPWLYFRYNARNDYWLEGAYVSAGLIRNMDYDTAVIGPSVFQDFRMQWFRDKLQIAPVNLSVKGLDNVETVAIANAVARHGKAKTMYICFVPYMFERNIDKGRIPIYLLDDSRINDYRYLYAYEAWFKFMPLDVATFFLNRINPNILSRYASLWDPDSLGNELTRYQFGADIALRNAGIPLKQTELSLDDKQGQLEGMKANFTRYIEGLKPVANTGIDYYFVLPPQSALYWYHQQLLGKIGLFQEFLQYVVEQMEVYPNISIVDCLTMEGTENLNHYRDSSHFDLVLQEKMVDYIATGEHIITSNNFPEMLARWSRIIDDFSHLYGTITNVSAIDCCYTK